MSTRCVMACLVLALAAWPAQAGANGKLRLHTRTSNEPIEKFEAGSLAPAADMFYIPTRLRLKGRTRDVESVKYEVQDTPTEDWAKRMPSRQLRSGDHQHGFGVASMVSLSRQDLAQLAAGQLERPLVKATVKMKDGSTRVFTTPLRLELTKSAQQGGTVYVQRSMQEPLVAAVRACQGAAPRGLELAMQKAARNVQKLVRTYSNLGKPDHPHVQKERTLFQGAKQRFRRALGLDR